MFAKKNWLFKRLNLIDLCVKNQIIRRANKRLFQPSGVPAIHYISCLVVRTRQEDAVPIRTRRKIEAFLPTVTLRFLELYI